jgi:hypothetical protein
MISKIRQALWVIPWHYHLVRIRLAIVLRRIIMLAGRRDFIEEVATISELNVSRSIAIIAIYPIDQKFYLDSLKNFLVGTRANGVDAIGVVNGVIPRQIENILKEFNCIIIKRKNKGRDFGAYQDGINWLYKHVGVDAVDRVILANDTLLWFSNSEQIIKDCLVDDWTALYFNLEQHAHAQSFFLSFSNKIIQNQKFRKFWKNYAATKYRRSAIIFGEMGLSSVLIKEGFSCSPLVNADWIHSKWRDISLDSSHFAMLNLLDINRLWKVEVPGSSRQGLSLIDENRKLEEIEDINSRLHELKGSNSLTPTIISQYCHSQGPHRIGLMLYLLFGIPLKADLYKANSLSDIFSAVKIRNPEVASSAHEFYLLQSQRYMLGTKANNRQKRRGEK